MSEGGEGEGGGEGERDARERGDCKDIVCATQQVIFRMAETEIWFVWDFQPFHTCCCMIYGTLYCGNGLILTPMELYKCLINEVSFLK